MVATPSADVRNIVRMLFSQKWLFDTAWAATTCGRQYICDQWGSIRIEQQNTAPSAVTISIFSALSPTRQRGGAGGDRFT
jgi:hypothetical protein